VLRYLRDYLSWLRERRRPPTPVTTQEQVQDFLVATIESLSPRERYVLVQLHVLRRPRADVIRELGISKKRLDKYMTAALIKIRSRFAERGVDPPPVSTDVEVPAAPRSTT
jgi:DNA-directed RNA polymerase specialized sigma24 family protein